jgi:hypothetical protein
MANDGLIINLEPTGRAIVDGDIEDTDAELLTWRLDTRTLYRPRAYSYVPYKGKKLKVYLERFVMKAPRNRFVRFRNGVTLDCRKANLEIVSSRSEVSNPDQ